VNHSNPSPENALAVSFRQGTSSIFSKRTTPNWQRRFNPVELPLGHVPAIWVAWGIGGCRHPEHLSAARGRAGSARSRFNALALLVTLAACEVILRVVDLRYLRMDESGIAPVYGHDSALGWYPIPNSAQTLQRRPHRACAPQQHRVARYRTRGDAKPTIAFVGDSFVWGYDAEEHERFTISCATGCPPTTSPMSG